MIPDDRLKATKAWAALLGSILTTIAGTTGLLPESFRPWVALTLAILTGVTTYAVPNTPVYNEQEHNDNVLPVQDMPPHMPEGTAPPMTCIDSDGNPCNPDDCKLEAPHYPTPQD